MTKKYDPDFKPQIFSQKTLDLLKKIPGKKFLDAGCGEGKISYWLKKWNKEVYAFDIDTSEFNIRGVSVEKADFNEKLPYKNNFFDCIVSQEVYEHIYDHKNYLEECHRILKPGGYLVMSTPNIHNWYTRIWFLLTGKLFLFQDKDYSPLGHVNPLIMNIFKKDIEGKFRIEKKRYNQSKIPLLRINVPFENEIFGDCVILKLKKV